MTSWWAIIAKLAGGHPDWKRPGRKRRVSSSPWTKQAHVRPSPAPPRARVLSLARAEMRRGAKRMAKLTNTDESGLAESLPLRAAEGQQPEVEGARLVTILYSHNREVYRVPAIDKPCWLSVKVYDL